MSPISRFHVSSHCHHHNVSSLGGLANRRAIHVMTMSRSIIVFPDQASCEVAVTLQIVGSQLAPAQAHQPLHHMRCGSCRSQHRLHVAHPYHLQSGGIFLQMCPVCQVHKLVQFEY